MLCKNIGCVSRLKYGYVLCMCLQYVEINYLKSNSYNEDPNKSQDHSD